jgi:CDP-paratose 2-epimerase
MTRAADLGLVQWFYPGQYELVEACIADLERLGVTRLRTHLSWADYHADGGGAWYDWLFARLGPRFELLPCVHYTPPSVAENGHTSGPPTDLKALADFTDHVIDRHGRQFEALELWNEPNNLLDWDWRRDPDWLKFCTMVGAAAYWARQCGKRVVLGGPCPTDLNWLRLVGHRGLLNVVDVVGIHGFPGTWDSVEGGTWPGWQCMLTDVRAMVEPFNDRLELWITEAGYSTWRYDPFAQVRHFADAIEAPAERVYWYGLRDVPAEVPVQEGHNFDVRHYHLGILTSDGQPKLLGRLLGQGLPAVQRMARADRAVAVVGRKQPLLVTGGAGFIGCNLADRLAADGENVLIYDSLARPGVEANLDWLRRRYPHRISVAIADVRDANALREAVNSAAAVFHLAAQVAVTTSLVSPRDDFEVNLLGTFNLLEALRRDPKPCVFASTNKVYGALQVELALRGNAYAPIDPHLHCGVNESQPLDLHTPYGCSKGAADQYVLDYARQFAVPAVVLRMSCIYGPRQLGTEDQGWVAHFVLRALQDAPITLYGDGHQVRDVLFVDDAVRAYIAAWRQIQRATGRAFNLGGGSGNAISLLQLIEHIEALLNRPVRHCLAPWRPDDQRYYVSDTRQVREALRLPEPLPWRRGVALLLEALGEAGTPLADGRYACALGGMA